MIDREHRDRRRRDPFWSWIAITLWFALGAIVGGAIGLRQALGFGRSDRAHILGLVLGALVGGADLGGLAGMAGVASVTGRGNGGALIGGKTACVIS
ncbi:MAG: hypothetical protein U0P30_15955 [Vicinamibacterales bacterium]